MWIFPEPVEIDASLPPAVGGDPIVAQLLARRGIVTPEAAAASAHEALIHSWTRLREWLDADRTFRAWQERLRRLIRPVQTKAHLA